MVLVGWAVPDEKALRDRKDAELVVICEDFMALCRVESMDLSLLHEVA